jgi:formate/nitrite transporter FocA (FNT family)
MVETEENNNESASVFDELLPAEMAAIFVANLIPVTIGNMIGGVFFVAPVYRVIYLRHHSKVV